MIGLAVVSFVLLLLSLYLLASHTYVWDAALLLLLAMGGLATALVKATVPRRRVNPLWWQIIPRATPGWMRWGALLFSAGAGLAARVAPQEHDFTLAFALWLAAVMAFAASFAVPYIRNERRSLRQLLRLPGDRREFWALIALLAIAGVVRGVSLGRIPANLGGDEGTQLLAGWRLVQPPLGNPFATSWYSVPTMSFVAYGLVMRLFGATIAGGRLLSAVAGTLTVLTSFLLGRAMGGRRVGWAAALVVAFSHYHIHFSRLASNQIFDPLVGSAALWLLWRAVDSEERGTHFWGLAGMVAGAGWYAYFGARWVTLLMAGLLVWRALRDRRFVARSWPGMMQMAAGWLVVVLPLLLWYAAHPTALTERYNAVSIFASGWLEAKMGITGMSALHLLLEQFFKAATAFYYTFDPTFWYYPNAPLLDFVTGALVLVGMVDALLRWRWPSRSWTLIWFWSTLVMAWVVTENPPSSQRGLLLVPALGLLAGWGIEALEALFRRRRESFTPILLGLAVVMVVFNLTFYFAVYTPRRVYGNPTAEIATALGRYLREDPRPDAAIYFFGPPTLYWDFGALAFLTLGRAGMDVLPGEMPDDVTAPARFILMPERVDALAAIRNAYPGGEVTSLTAPDGRVLAVIYDW